MTGSKQQPWIRNAAFDSALILAPAFIAVIAALLWHAYAPTNETPPWVWLLLVVGIDVAHVYSTLFKTYFRSSEFAARKSLFLTIPVAVLVVGILLFSTNAVLFWSILAYAAVFHFVRQQYGFLRIYSRAEKLQRPLLVNIDKLMVYGCTVLPVIWWHLAGDRTFNWLIKGDFLITANSELAAMTLICLYATWAIWSLKECWVIFSTKFINLPKVLIVLGTALSWYFGIVHFNSDAVFTITNVVAHGIPYLGLVWMTEQQDKHHAQRFIEHGPNIQTVPRLKISITAMLPIIIALAWFEEGLWSGLIFKEHGLFFPGFDALPHISNHLILSIAVPLLAVPQATHYIIDGFIWKQK